MTITENARQALDDAIGKAISGQEECVVAAVRFIALRVREVFPDAKRVELDDSDQGDWLIAMSIDGDVEATFHEDLEDDLSWATSNMVDSHREAAKDKGLKTRAEGRSLTRSSGGDLYIDIEEALRGHA